MFKMILSAGLLATLSFYSALASAGDASSKRNTANIWPTIPFVRGADLCRYADAYGQTRTQYVQEMTSLASQLMWVGAGGREALGLLTQFNEMYDRNLAIATSNNYLDVTLESTLKAYVDQMYRDLRPRNKNISFTNVNNILSIVRSANQGLREGYLDADLLQDLDFIAYGTYAFAPNCQGDIQVTLHLIGRDDETRSYVGTGKPGQVMQVIAARLFEDFQRTHFPSKLKLGPKVISLIGGMNGSVDQAASPKLAEEFCQVLGARLPTAMELEISNGYGDWSGGVSFGDKVWALANGKVFAPQLRNPTPIREQWEVNDKEFYYYCVKP